MKKKKQRNLSPPPAAAAATTNTTTSDLKSLIHDHGLFFDKLVELIPAKFYLSNDDANDSKPWFQGLSKAAKASAKQQTRENIKKARRDRLDPEKSQTTTLDRLKQTIQDEGLEQKINLDGADNSKSNRSVTYEELQQRLHSKLEELRANRGQGKRSLIDRSDRKRKRSDDFEGKKNGGDGNLGKFDGEIEKDVNEATKGIEFGKLKIETDEERERKKRKGSKSKELERAKRLEEAKKDPDKGEVVAKKHSWKAATSRAMGIKVHDNARILKESIKKEKKRHEKNVGKWKERVESREKLKGDKQQKRTGNIAERAQQNKARKIAKREKKLMRPGFEGRKR